MQGKKTLQMCRTQTVYRGRSHSTNDLCTLEGMPHEAACGRVWCEAA